MAEHLYTMICEFRDGTYLSQVEAPTAKEAVEAWATLIKADKPIPSASANVARNVLHMLRQEGATSLSGLEDVWCVMASCGGDIILLNVVQSG
jgi:hypothetical protein